MTQKNAQIITRFNWGKFMSRLAYHYRMPDAAALLSILLVYLFFQIPPGLLSQSPPPLNFDERYVSEPRESVRQRGLH